MTVLKYGTIEVTKYEMPRRVTSTQGVTLERLLPMPLNDTPSSNTISSDYETDPETGAVRLPVKTSGALVEECPVVHVLLDHDVLDTVEKYKWTARRASTQPSIATSVKSEMIPLARVVWTAKHGEFVSRIGFKSDDRLDFRAANLVPISKPVAIEPEIATPVIRGSAVVGRLRSSQPDTANPRQHYEPSIEDAQARAREIDPTIPLLPAPVKIRAQYRRRGSLSASRRKAILDRDAGICFYCEYEADAVDHIIPYAYGGTDDDENLIACCSICNGIASDKVFDTLQEKRDYVRGRYGRYMKRRYRRFLSQNSVCADCESLYNPGAPGASNLLCPKCYARS